ncbi:EamA family transporter [Pedobacter duraquae]|uniref:Inner membrane transporter RhtA n=1 Tax=Pedobacter duraquae TaxID=425511 RepID=A0A4R6IP07_9SPHI|nr:DMT family transporter [Pedobacter duraquae]TDO23980.1 inner membrane transporter RhtA [Pedobacter duraquae]
MEPNTTRKPILAPIPAVILAIISVQGGAAIAKGLFPVIGPASTASLRIGISALILLAVNRPNLRILTGKQWKAVIPYGLMLGAMNFVFYLAAERIPLGLAVALEFVGPLLVAVLGSKRKTDYLWVVLAAGGIALIAPWTAKGLDPMGVGLALLAGAFWAGYIIMGSAVSKVISGGTAVTVGMLVASIIIVPFGVASGGFEKLTLGLSLSGIALALLSSAIPFSLEMSALHKLPKKTFGILMSLEPAAAAICGLIFIHEVLSLKEWIAVMLIVLASLGAALTAKTQKDQ